MSLHFANWDERTLDLAVERYTTGLDSAGVDTLERDTLEEDLNDFEAVLAAIHLGELEPSAPPPLPLLERLEAEGREQVERRARVGDAPHAPAVSPSPAPHRKGPIGIVSTLGWGVAAALAITLVLDEGELASQPVTRAELVARADAVQLDWSATDDEAASGATGDVVWSTSEQRGFMTFRGLEPNDPATSQYQLWIFDPTRADWEAKPIDGGVFDVSDDAEVVVEIDAKLEVRETALFAVTIEKPGGVVVSERERLVLTAAP